MNELTIHEKKDISILETSWNALSKETRRAYQFDLDQFMRFCNRKIEDVSSADIANYIAHLRNEKLKNATINRKIASISKMFTVYLQAGMIQVNPISIVRTLQKTNYKTQRNVKSPIEFEILKKALEKPRNRHEVQIILIIKFLAKTGCRITEALTAKRSEIIPHSKNSDKIMVFGKGQKERYVYLDKKLKEQILKYFDCDDSDLLFCTDKKQQINRTYFWKLMTDFFKLKTGLHVHPHMLRHFFATYKIYTEKKDIKSVSKSLGHSSVAITLDMYVDTVLSEEDAEVKL